MEVRFLLASYVPEPVDEGEDLSRKGGGGGGAACAAERSPLSQHVAIVWGGKKGGSEKGKGGTAGGKPRLSNYPFSVPANYGKKGKSEVSGLSAYSFNVNLRANPNRRGGRSGGRRMTRRIPFLPRCGVVCERKKKRQAS